jgi:hypothetical protein
MKSERRSFPRSAGRGDATVAFPSPGERGGGRVAEKRPSRGIDLEMLLEFSQQLYAHALTLQEVIRNQGEATYEVLRPGYDRVAAQQFEVFYPTVKRSSGLRKRGAGSGE